MDKRGNDLFDEMGVAFQDHFRGNRADIKDRLKVYLPYISKSNSGARDARILDVGCGRGEWLELLREQGHVAGGVDINRAMVTQCRELGLDVMESDVIDYLKKQESSTLSAITGFHLIEHLALKTMFTLFDEALRVLRPGGMIIFETPNPENLIVGATNFYLDPTHRHPIPPATLTFLIEARGYSKVSILRLNPNPMLKTLENETLQNLLFGPMDYAVIAFKN
jgi:O-antigen chain-terminating methyltransferase